MNNSTLLERCSVNINSSDDEFVGLKNINGDISIHFPLGFSISDTEEKLRKDILLLFNVLKNNSEKRLSSYKDKDNNQSVDFPIQAYLFMIMDFYNRGYYIENEITYKSSKNGKINWSKTIRKQKPFIQNDSAYYLEFIVKSKNVNENAMITSIHKFCVYESFKKMGWLYSNYLPPKPLIKYNKKLFVQILKKKITETFNDRNKQLFNNMLSIVNSLGDKNEENNNFTFGVMKFQDIWENMIDKVYGIYDKQKYFPKSFWFIDDQIVEKAPLRPDTIIEGENKIYILDSKFYRYGETNIVSHLPETTSIHKQITYGEYIEQNEKFKNENGDTPQIYNAFLMPFNCGKEKVSIEEQVKYIGYANSAWKRNDKTYENILGFVIDVKSLMKNYSHDDKKIYYLSKLIESKIDKIINKS